MTDVHKNPLVSEPLPYHISHVLPVKVCHYWMGLMVWLACSTRYRKDFQEAKLVNDEWVAGGGRTELLGSPIR